MVLRSWRRSRRRGAAHPEGALRSVPDPDGPTPADQVVADPAMADPVDVAPDVAPAPAAEPVSEPAAELDPAALDDATLLAEADALAEGSGPFAAIDLLRRANAERRDPAIDARILQLRHAAYASLPSTPGREEWPPQVEDRFPGVTGCPEVALADLDADVLASAITHHGCLLVRGLVDPAGATELVETIDESFRACDARNEPGEGDWPASWFTPFRPGPGYPGPKEGHRGWVRSAGGVLAADSPPAFETMVRAFEAAGLREVISGYMGERPLLSVDKCTLRRVPLDLGGAEWHQDGSFLGNGIRTLNVWLALTACGGDHPSPGLDLVPRRFDAILPTGSDGAYFDWSVGPQLVERLAVDNPVIRPEFAPGDALLFDDLFLHRTALEPTQTVERHAIESWFFAASAYPGDSVPIVF